MFVSSLEFLDRCLHPFLRSTFGFDLIEFCQYPLVKVVLIFVRSILPGSILLLSFLDLDFLHSLVDDVPEQTVALFLRR